MGHDLRNQWLPASIDGGRCWPTSERGAGVKPAAVVDERTRLEHLGVQIDATLNDDDRSEADRNVSVGPVKVLVVTSREELEIARDVATILPVS
jgi:acetate kinase